MKHKSFRVLRFLLVVIVIAAAAHISAFAAAGISTVSITIDAPAAGAYPDYTAEFPDGAMYYSDTYDVGSFHNDIQWLNIVSGVAVDPDIDTFQPGYTYQANIFLTASPGYEFTSGTTAKVNGNTAQTELSGNQLLVTYTFPKLNGTISSVSVILDAPAAGAQPDYTAEFPDGANYQSTTLFSGAFRSGILWFDETAKENVDPLTGRFKAGHKYSLTMYLEPKGGYSFNYETAALLNGQEADTNWNSGDGELRVVYSFPAIPIPIDSVSIYLDAPIAFESPDYTAYAHSGAHYGVEQYSAGNVLNGVAWRDETGEGFNLDPGTDKFQPAHVYLVSVNLVPEEGYEFTGEISASINGNNAEMRVTDFGEYYLVYTFPPAREPVYTVEVYLDEPIAGCLPDYTAELLNPELYHTSGFSGDSIINGIMWYDTTDEFSLLPGSDVFEAGHEYRVTVDLLPADGYTLRVVTSVEINDVHISLLQYGLGEMLTVERHFTVGGDISRGDVNLDGKVDSSDLTTLARHVAGISDLTDPQALSNADVTGEGDISASDLTKLARFVAQIEDTL